MAEVKPDRLSDADVYVMRVRYLGGRTQAELAAEFGATQGYVSRVVRGLARRRAGGPIVVRSWGEVGPSAVNL